MGRQDTYAIKKENLAARAIYQAEMFSFINYIICRFFAVDDSTKERICRAISAEASGFAAFTALSDMSAIRVSSPVIATVWSLNEKNGIKLKSKFWRKKRLDLAFQ